MKRWSLSSQQVLVKQMTVLDILLQPHKAIIRLLTELPQLDHAHSHYLFDLGLPQVIQYHLDLVMNKIEKLGFQIPLYAVSN